MRRVRPEARKQAVWTCVIIGGGIASRDVEDAKKGMVAVSVPRHTSERRLCGT